MPSDMKWKQDRWIGEDADRKKWSIILTIGKIKSTYSKTVFYLSIFHLLLETLYSPAFYDGER